MRKDSRANSLYIGRSKIDTTPASNRTPAESAVRIRFGRASGKRILRLIRRTHLALALATNPSIRARIAAINRIPGHASGAEESREKEI
jgi:hypothetical protein